MVFEFYVWCFGILISVCYLMLFELVYGLVVVCNVGWCVVCGEIIVFIDDDIILMLNWLCEGLWVMVLGVDVVWGYVIVFL